MKYGVDSGGIALCKCYRELKRLHWAVSTPCHFSRLLSGCSVHAWRGEHLLLPYSSGALAHTALSALARVALKTLACSSPPQTNWVCCVLVPGLVPFLHAARTSGTFFPNTEAKVLWLNILVLEAWLHRGLIPLLRKEMS